MKAICLSGTGNTKHLVSLLLSELGQDGRLISIESDSAGEVFTDEEILIGYPTQFSNIPYMVRDFINRH